MFVYYKNALNLDKLNLQVISVISVTYNSNRVIRGTFKDLLNKSDVEIFVVDNDSIDNTVAIVNGIKADNIHIIENMKNIGYGRANNVALKQASKEFILLLNPDASISYEKLNYLVKIMNHYLSV